MLRRVPLAAAAAAVLAAAGCTSSAPVHHATSSPSTRPSVVDPVSHPVSAPATTSRAPSTSAAISSTPSPTRTAPGVPACLPPSVTVAKAPFCYTLPHGFTNYSSLKDYGTGWTYRTLVSVGQHDLVEVLAAGGADTDTASEAALRSQYDKAFLLRAGALGIAQAGPARRTSVDGARAYRQVARYRTGVSTDITTVYRGHTVLSIQCQSRQQKAAVATACAAVHTSLDLVRR